MENNIEQDPSLDLTLSQKFFLEKIKLEAERMSKADLQEYIVKLMEMQYRKDKMWLKMVLDK